MDEILKLIPHRPPFLFVDEIVAFTGDTIQTRRRVRPEEPFFQGHYPDYPIMPGVLVCEAVFQSGALLLAKRGARADQRIPVLTRVQGVKLKQAVYPGDTLEMTVTLDQELGPASYLKGKVVVQGRTALTVDFAVTAMERER